ncbi:DNA translocase FtsK 4TM domain-containing protein, partial [Myxococcota bacterium]|nr:DNA translocase FtsK 4TM domain-containing protein [Myxococcota bacterium]
MARASARARSKRGGRGSREVELEAEESAVLTGAGSELLGLGLIAFSLLATLALATYSTSDPIASLVDVRNGAGPVGATVAGLLMNGLGCGAFVFVAGTAFLGGRLLMSLGLPGPFSRFWLGMLALIPTAAVLPLLLFELAPGQLPWIEPGWLGTEWSRLQTLLFGGAGALILSTLLLAVGLFSLTGVSVGAALGLLGRAGGFVIDRILWAADALVPVADRAFDAFGRGLGALRAGLVDEAARARESIDALLVRRAQRARRARVD